MFPHITDSERKAYLIGTFSQDDFCPGQCEYLSITEEEQDKIRQKQDHICLKYNQRVKHGAYHPLLMKCVECMNNG